MKKQAQINLGLSFTVIFFCVSFLILFIGKLFLEHLMLLLQNLTFYEKIKDKWTYVPYKNPFDKRKKSLNLKFLICKRVPKQNLNLFNRNSYLNNKLIFAQKI